MANTQNQDKAVKTSTTSVTIRRAPKFVPFGVTGGLLAALVALIAGLSIHNDDPKTTGFITYLVSFGAVVGASVGVLAALIADRITRSRAKQAEATRTTLNG